MASFDLKRFVELILSKSSEPLSAIIHAQSTESVTLTLRDDDSLTPSDESGLIETTLHWNPGTHVLTITMLGGLDNIDPSEELIEIIDERNDLDDRLSGVAPVLDGGDPVEEILLCNLHRILISAGCLANSDRFDAVVLEVRDALVAVALEHMRDKKAIMLSLETEEETSPRESFTEKRTWLH